MTKTTVIMLTVLTLLVANSVAGPFHSAIIDGTDVQKQFVIQIPSGRAISILNLIDQRNLTKSSVVCALPDGTTTEIVRAILIDDAASKGINVNKEVIVDGPATITVIAPVGQKSYFSYRLFAN